jgi:hypothetical protein
MPPITQTDIQASELDQVLRDQAALTGNTFQSITPAQMETALGNWASIDRTISISNQTGTANGKVCLAAIVLSPKVSGIFDVDVNLTFSCNTTAIKCNVVMVTIPLIGAAAVLTSGGTKAAAGIFGKYVDASTDAQILTSDAAGTAISGLLAGGVAITDAAAGGLTQFQLLTRSITGTLTTDGAGCMDFTSAGLVHNAVASTVKTPFSTTVANQRVVFGLQFQDLTTGAEVWHFDNLTFTVREVPLG